MLIHVFEFRSIPSELVVSFIYHWLRDMCTLQFSRESDLTAYQFSLNHYAWNPNIVPVFGSLPRFNEKQMLVFSRKSNFSSVSFCCASSFIKFFFARQFLVSKISSTDGLGFHDYVFRCMCGVYCGPAIFYFTNG